VSDDATEELSSAEEVLRHLLHASVRDLEPSPRTLQHLQSAVPARRARRRQVLVGAAASLILAVAAVPAVIHTTNSAHESAAAPSRSTIGPPPQGVQGGQGANGNRKAGSLPGGSPRHSGKEKKKGPGGTGASGHVTAGPSESPGEGETSGDGAPCTATQLSGSGGTESPDGTGKVYGTFTLSNVSESNCSVTGVGSFSAKGDGGADSGLVSAVPHTAGDPATNLPVTSSGSFTLAPGQSFAVKFAWVPASGMTGCEATGQPTTGGDSDGDGGGDATDATDAAVEDTPSGNVLVSYTPDAGGGAARSAIQGVCAGTVYYTPPIASGP
jgi:Protein of unknown function (DUF4232)